MLIEKVENKILWMLTRNKLSGIGSNSHVGINFRIKGSKYITIGNNFHSGPNLVIEAWDHYRGKKVADYCPSIIIGDNVSMMSNCQISAAKGVSVGSGCLFGDNVFITDNYHGKGDEFGIPPLERDLFVKGEVVIGNNVWIGRNVCIMPNVTIGDNAIIGANAVVTKDVAPGKRVAGIPAAEI